jgi:putative acetyltransferase
MTKVQVRAFEERDVLAIYEVMRCPGVIYGTLQTPFQSFDGMRERLTRPDPNRYQFVAEVDGRVVGTLGLHLEPAPRRRHAATVGMGVHDDFQGRGVGTALMQAMLDLADNWLGLTRLELEVYTDNAAAIHLYEKFGFSVEGTKRRLAMRQGTYVDGFVMARLR